MSGVYWYAAGPEIPPELLEALDSVVAVANLDGRAEVTTGKYLCGTSRPPRLDRYGESHHDGDVLLEVVERLALDAVRWESSIPVVVSYRRTLERIVAAVKGYEERLLVVAAERIVSEGVEDDGE